MRERPILFSAPMVRAILDGRKPQTRRIIRDEWWRCLDPEDEDDRAQALTMCPYGVPGDRLWVRETWGPSYAQHVSSGRSRTLGGTWGCPAHPEWRACVVYRADGDMPQAPDGYETAGWIPSIHMPRWVSRITLEITGVRVERLQEISEDDARAEGVTTSDIPVRINGELGTMHTFGPDAHRQAFRLLWDVINGKRAAWASNPWVWVVGFKRVEP